MPADIFDDTPATLAPLDEEVETPQFRLADHVGQLAVFDVKNIETVTTKYGDKEAARVDVFLVDDGTQYNDALLFNTAPVQDLAAVAGRRVVRRIESYLSKKWNKEVLRLRKPTAEELAAAKKALAG